ncbi:MAG: LL-diaminopimelate aminotransferase [Chitinispirillales bacterium]|jgi:LL-diaminopimelate aminotransferase|nr:LL-diaminopimelate aminotransferase [Chitinispirillales bacterium]
MIKINENYLKLTSSYLFAEIDRRVAEFQKSNPDKNIIRLGIGDVTRPLAPACVEAFQKAVDEMGQESGFKGYGPYQGYPFLREQIAKNDFQSRGADISGDEIFISDGAKCDTANFQELFSQDITVAVPDPVYPVYVDTNVMAGRTGTAADGRYGGLVYLEGNTSNGFIQSPPDKHADLIYLCFPNNPTGAAATKEQLKAWVDYAKKEKALILFDAAYEAFISDPSIPHSIYEIEGAREVAVEFRSFSKTAGFTGTRCASTVVPSDCKVYDSKGEAHSLNAIWSRRHSTKFNGVSYPVQCAAEAVYSQNGRAQIRESIDYYMTNAKLIKEKMSGLGYSCTGGVNAPYIWIECKSDSWKFFDMLLNDAGVVCTPGAGFGRCGEGFIRISAFNSMENVKKALEKIEKAVR